MSTIESAPIFSASRVKLARARQFIRELANEADKYKTTGSLTGVLDPVAGNVKVQTAAIGLMPGAIVGDAIHNMRTALDLMASELARINEKSDADVYFPFAHEAAALDEAIRKRRFEKAGDDAVALLKKFAPYRGGNDALRAIHDLDISDKHTTLIPAGSSIEFGMNASYNVETGEAMSLNLVIKSVNYRFPDGETFGGKHIVQTLEELVQLVDGIVDAFEAMVLARRVK